MSRFEVVNSWVGYEVPEDSGIISEQSSGIGSVYNVQLDSRYVGAEEDYDDAEFLLSQAMDLACFWPDCFYINNRGNVDQIVRSI